MNHFRQAVQLAIVRYRLGRAFGWNKLAAFMQAISPGRTLVDPPGNRAGANWFGRIPRKARYDFDKRAYVSRFALAIIALALLVSVSSARPRHFRGQTAQPAAQAAVPGPAPVEALAEVNAARLRLGLRPFLPDPALSRAALVCAQFRAERLIEGHSANDFNALEAGAFCRATGAGADDPSQPWLSCCTKDAYTYAGAAYCIGRDGRRFMSLYCR